MNIIIEYYIDSEVYLGSYCFKLMCDLMTDC